MTVDTKEFKIKLETQLARLEGELKSVGRRNPSNSADWEAVEPERNDDAADPIDVAASIDSYEENTAILKQLEIEYNQVKRALERVSAGTYGICTVCNEPIDPKRLEAFPAAETCVVHAK